jgi:hypothetical protein
MYLSTVSQHKERQGYQNLLQVFPNVSKIRVEVAFDDNLGQHGGVLGALAEPRRALAHAVLDAKAGVDDADMPVTVAITIAAVKGVGECDLVLREHAA